MENPFCATKVMIFVLIFITLTLASIASFQFLYLFFLERIEIEHKTRIKQLERECKKLTEKLRLTEKELAVRIANEKAEEETWADVLIDG